MKVEVGKIYTYHGELGLFNPKSMFHGPCGYTFSEPPVRLECSIHTILPVEVHEKQAAWSHTSSAVCIGYVDGSYKAFFMSVWLLNNLKEIV